MNLAVTRPGLDVYRPAARAFPAREQRIWQEPLLRLLDIMEARTRALRVHACRVESCCLQAAEGMGILGERLISLQIAALLHDVGKIGLPPAILDKPGRFSPEEFLLMQTHCARGEKILREMGLPADACRFVRHHHERFDGKGYPDGLQGAEIDPEARILAVADAYVALTEDRPCRPALSCRTAMEWVATVSGIRFDPEVVRCFLDVPRT
jgi:HD-GYP domain-containing protein (c-di-GMP phosphodiesterase class II)